MKTKTDKTVNMHGWPYEEKSSRNCIHCKVWRIKGLTGAYCKFHGKEYSLSLDEIIRCDTWAFSFCAGCSTFDHDIPLIPADRGRAGAQAIKDKYGLDYMREQVANARSARKIPPVDAKGQKRREYMRDYMANYRRGIRRKDNGQ